MVNYVRRATGIVLCYAPVVLLLVSLGNGLMCPRASALAMGLAVTGLLVAGLNLYLTHIRPTLYVWRHGTTDGLRCISGVPLVGTLLVVAGGLVGFGDWRVAVVGLVASALDTGGTPWFMLSTWRDHGFWDD